MKKKRNKRKGKTGQAQGPIKPSKYIQKHARKYPVYECWIDQEWEEKQYSPVLVSRKKPNGRLILGVYIVDLQCLGVKETGYQHDLEPDEYEDQLDVFRENMGIPFVSIEPNLCFNIIYGAIEFAEDCGFYPHKDFAVSKYILDDLESIEFVDVPFGKDGKPFFIAGPYDNVSKIIATLDRHVGKGNYDYMLPFPGGEFLEDNEETLGNYFPEETIQQKLDSFADEKDKLYLNLLLNIAAIIFEKANFELDTIEEQYTGQDDVLFDEVLEEVLSMEGLSPKNNEIPLPEAEKFEYLTEWVFEKIIEFKGPHFLWKADFVPYYKPLAPEAYEKLSNEEAVREEEKRMFYMSRREQDHYLVQKLFVFSIEEASADELKDSKYQQEVIDSFLKSMKEDHFQESWDDDLEAFFRDVAWDTLEKIQSIET